MPAEPHFSTPEHRTDKRQQQQHPPGAPPASTAAAAAPPAASGAPSAPRAAPASAAAAGWRMPSRGRQPAAGSARRRLLGRGLQSGDAAISHHVRTTQKRQGCAPLRSHYFTSTLPGIQATTLAQRRYERCAALPCAPSKSMLRSAVEYAWSTPSQTTPSATAAGTAACSFTTRGSVQYSGTMRMEAAPSGRKRNSTRAVARYALQQQAACCAQVTCVSTEQPVGPVVCRCMQTGALQRCGTPLWHACGGQQSRCRIAQPVQNLMSGSSLLQGGHLRQSDRPLRRAVSASATAFTSRLKGLRPCPVRGSAASPTTLFPDAKVSIVFACCTSRSTAAALLPR